ncbi:hypothetical protein HMI54_015491 [Coelomomyces lativittatus]|nr:hypothetical protein HMI56_001032 [Coelomomyces lativittatus]KAJ1512801.1 hypothetical protein HMI54_015491 [Coelomomyces lativittatus]KAJ1516448.1 hypothetical protein HMI55_002240 [Coelomomyces lativittatus]
MSSPHLLNSSLPYSTKWLHRFITLFSFALLFHSAYSAFEHVTYLKSINRTNEPLPSDIVLETLLATFLCLFSVLLLTDPFKPISLASDFQDLPRAAYQFHPHFVYFPSRVRFFSAFTDKLPSVMLNEKVNDKQSKESKKNRKELEIEKKLK